MDERVLRAAPSGLGRVVVIGVGNALRGDDALGVMVAERVQLRRPELDVVIVRGDLLELCTAWAGAELAIVVDAMAANEAPGTVCRFEALDEAASSPAFRGSTHAIGLADAVALGRAVGSLPRRLVVYGAVGSRFALGDAVSPPVARAAEELVERIIAECHAHA